MRKVYYALGGLLGALCLTGQSPARADDAVAMARTYKEGDTARYKVTLKISAEGNQMITVTQNTKYQVKTVNPDGGVVLLATDLGGTLDLGAGQPQNLPPGSTMTVTMDKSGKLTDLKVDKPNDNFSSGTLQLIEIAHHIILSDKPVKEGDSWETQLDDPVVKGKQVTIKDTYLGTEKREGATLWKIKQTVEAQVNDTGDKMTSEMTSLLDPKTGGEVHEEGNVKNMPTVNYGLMSWKEELVLLKPDDDTKQADADTKKPAP